MKFLQDIIKNPTERKYLENDSYFTNYSDDYEDEGFWGYGMICQNSSTQSDIDVEVRYDEDEDAFLALVIFNIDQIYDDNKDFFNKCLKDMGFHRTRQKEWVEFKQYIIEEKYWNDIVLDDVDVEDQVQEVAVAITKELFMRMEKAGIKPDKKEEEIEMENNSRREIDMTRNKYTGPYPKAVENIQKVVRWIAGNDSFRYTYYEGTTLLVLEIESLICRQVDEDGGVTFKLELYGKEDGTLITRIIVVRDGTINNSFGDHLCVWEIAAINEMYRDASNFAKEMETVFDFIEIERRQ